MLNNVYFQNTVDVACNAILSASLAYGASAFLGQPLGRVQAAKVSAIASVVKDIFQKSSETLHAGRFQLPSKYVLQVKLVIALGDLCFAASHLTASSPYLSTLFKCAGAGLGGLTCYLIVQKIDQQRSSLFVRR